MSDFGLGLIMDGGRSSHLPTRACRNGRCSPDLSSIRSWSASESSSCCGVWGVECGVLCFVTAHLSSKVNLPQAIDLRRKFGHATPHNLGGTKPSKSTVWDWVWDRSEMLAAIHRQSIDPAAGPCRQFPARARARERERGRGRERERERERVKEREREPVLVSGARAREVGALLQVPAHRRASHSARCCRANLQHIQAIGCKILRFVCAGRRRVLAEFARASAEPPGLLQPFHLGLRGACI